eukprot:6204324-Pleurochrysis_carterae.AAC.2
MFFGDSGLRPKISTGRVSCPASPSVALRPPPFLPNGFNIVSRTAANPAASEDTIAPSACKGLDSHTQSKICTKSRAGHRVALSP